MAGYQAKSNSGNDSKANKNVDNRNQNASNHPNNPSLKNDFVRKGTSVAMQAVGVPKPIADFGAKQATNGNLGKKMNPAQVAKNNDASLKKQAGKKEDIDRDKGKNSENKSSNKKSDFAKFQENVNNLKNLDENSSKFQVFIVYLRTAIASISFLGAIFPLLLIFLVLISSVSLLFNYKEEHYLFNMGIGLGAISQENNTPSNDNHFYSPIQGENIVMYGANSSNGGFNHDISAATGTKLYSPADGTATFRTSTRNGKIASYGNSIYITTSDGYEFRLGHLDTMEGITLKYGSSSTYPSSCASNDRKCDTYLYATREVKKGELIGTVGESGNAKGAHLHLEVWKDGNRLAPESYFGY